MSHSDFKQISLLPIRRSAKTTEGRKVEFSKAQIFRFDEMHPGKMLMKTCLSGCFEEVFIEPMTRTLRLGTDGLPAKYSETLKLKSAKLRDVKSLLPFVPFVHHAQKKTLHWILLRRKTSTSEANVTHITISVFIGFESVENLKIKHSILLDIFSF